MSLPFSTIISSIDRKLGTNSTTYTTADKTVDINLSIDKILGFMFPRGGTWQLDDSNHTDYPIIYANIQSGISDYPFTTDEQGNYILDIERVMILPSATSTEYQDIIPVDAQKDPINGISSESSTTGIPEIYDKTANSITIYPIPNYNVNKGIKVDISREASYFVATDTTKRLGFAHLFHEYLILRPCYMYASDKNLASAERWKRDMLEMEAEIKKYFDTREKDVEHRIINEPIDFM